MGTQIEKYEEWLTTIANTRLICNTMEELEELLGSNSIHNNGMKKSFPTPQRQRSVFRDLKVEVDELTLGAVVLEELLEQYRNTWNFFRDRMARRTNLRGLALEMLRYLGMSSQNQGGKKRKELFEEVRREPVNMGLLVLMMLHIIPGYDSKEGDVKDIRADYELAMDLLAEYAADCPYADMTPAIQLALQEKLKTRLTLIFHVNSILGKVEGYMTPDRVYDTGKNWSLSSVALNLAGYWNECDGTDRNSDFWELEPTDNTSDFFATHWTKKTNHLEGVRYTWFPHQEDDGGLVVYMLHPCAIKTLLKGENCGDKEQAWFVGEMPQAEAPARLLLKRRGPSEEWPAEFRLTRVTDAALRKTYEGWLQKKDWIKEPFEDCRYVFTPHIEAITTEFVFVPSEREGEYFRIPRQAHPGFDKIQMGDKVGLLRLADGKAYLGFDDLKLYVSTSEEELKKYGIERVPVTELAASCLHSSGSGSRD
jgi:hypothetical protein